MHFAVDPNRCSLYVTDNSGIIRKFDSNGNFITKWGSMGSADGQFDSLGDIAVDSSGNVYVSDSGISGNDRIQKFDSNGNFITKWDVPGSLNGIAVNLNTGNVFVIGEKIVDHKIIQGQYDVQVFAPKATSAG